MVQKETSLMQSSKVTSKTILKLSKLPFPFKLHEMLSDVTKDAQNEVIVSWQPHGKAFRVHKPAEFEVSIMQIYFNHNHYKSFQRQLHLYGFRRILSGIDKGAYYHKQFLRENVSMCFQMTRCKIKGNKAKSLQHETSDPDFYSDVHVSNTAIESHSTPLDPKHGSQNFILGDRIMIQRTSSLVQSISNDAFTSYFGNKTKSIGESSTHECRTDDHFHDGDEAFFEGRKFFAVDAASNLILC